MFFVTLRTKRGRVILTRPANSETKEVRTMKLYTVMPYCITSITKQLQFLTFHRSIVCSYCSVACLIAKLGLKMIEFSGSLKLNEIHMVDNPFNEDPKNTIFFQGGPNFG